MKNITVPELGESIIEGTITSWLVKEGENFKSGDNLAEIETEKITIEIPAQSSGKLTKIIAPVGATVNVGQSIACLLYTSPSPRDGLLSRMPSSA